ncbi:MAG: hypothetical protein K2F56_02650, partial [Anaeroplasmataceae bacterium]|nr:hypothetical protein [Anaeroplasmataceae bacterium]
NILKKISKTSLVLVVTHNEEVANFYSDEVIRIRDGSIIDSYKNDGSQSLNTQQSNTIYLKDMDHSLISNEQANVHMYTNETAPVINLDIMYVNGTFYLRSDSKIKISADTNIKILDEHKKSIDLETIEKHDYDTSWFSSPKKRPNPFGMFWQSFVKSYNKIRYSRKRTKVLYFAFVLVGILLAACVVGYSNFSTIDDSSFVADPHYDQLYNDLYVSYIYENEFMYKNLTEGNISDVEKVVSFSVSLSKKVNFNEQVTTLLPINTISTSTRKLSLECGEMPSKGEILVSRRMADQIIEEYGYFFSSYQALLGQSLKVVRKPSTFFPEELVISGISSNTSNLNYINDEDYMSTYSTIFEVKSTLIPNIKWRHWPVESKYNTYTVVAGRDLNESDRVSHNILMPSNYPNADKYLAGVPFDVFDSSGKDKNPSLGGSGLEYITSYAVVGLFELNDAATAKEDFIGYTSSSFSYSVYQGTTETFQYHDYKIIEGKEPTAVDECIVGIYSAFSVGETLDGGRLKIVGKYVSDYDTLQCQVLCHRDFTVMNNASECWFHVDKSNQLYFPQGSNAVGGSTGVSKVDSTEVRNTYDYLAIPLRAEHKTEQLVFGCASIGTIVVLGLFIYLMMRSKMISEISTIGIYRCLGQSRAKIMLQFVFDILITVTLTSLLGFLISMGLFELFAFNFQNTLLVNVAKKASEFIGYSVLALYALNLIFGLLPIYFLLRKTPAEIVSKYDI